MPLAITQAAAIISQRAPRYTVTRYLNELLLELKNVLECFCNVLTFPISLEGYPIPRFYPSNLPCLLQNNTFGRSVSKVRCFFAITISTSVGPSLKTDKALISVYIF
jgi:hypothetical protein